MNRAHFTMEMRLLSKLIFYTLDKILSLLERLVVWAEEFELRKFEKECLKTLALIESGALHPVEAITGLSSSEYVSMQKFFKKEELDEDDELW